MRSGLASLSALLWLGCGGVGPPPLLVGQTTSGVALPCYNAESPADASGRSYTAVDGRGVLQHLDVTASDRDAACSAADEPAFLLALEDLSATPLRREEDGAAFARCTDHSGLFGSHILGRPTEGTVLLVRADLPLGDGARVLPSDVQLSPPGPRDDPVTPLDADGDGEADYLLYKHGRATDTSDPDSRDMSFSTMCLDVFDRDGDAWRSIYSGCAEHCAPVVH